MSASPQHHTRSLCPRSPVICGRNRVIGAIAGKVAEDWPSYATNGREAPNPPFIHAAAKSQIEPRLSNAAAYANGRRSGLRSLPQASQMRCTFMALECRHVN